jgi:hypothetical protein
MADNKYKALVESTRWNQPSDEEKRIVALTAQLDAFKKVNAKPGNKDKKGGKTDKKEKSNSKGGDMGAPEYPDWKVKPPGKGEKHAMRKDKKTFFWCPNHNAGKGLWVVHKPSDCNNQPKGDGDPSNKRPEGKPKQLTVAKALQAIMEHDDDSDE